MLVLPLRDSQAPRLHAKLAAQEVEVRVPEAVGSGLCCSRGRQAAVLGVAQAKDPMAKQEELAVPWQDIERQAS